ncbi:MAG: AEC family transporter [Candidatus Omnitrophota bacterium]|nr:MAG: AEC family transporter [Candidatus Omnitrophota bacterium]
MSAISFAVLKLCLIAVFGFILYRKRIVDRRVLDFLMLFVINFTIPCLFFSRLIDNTQIVLSHSLWNFIFLSIVIFLLGYGLGILASLKKSKAVRREFVSMVSFQNSGYLPMNIAFFLFAPGLRDKFLVYIILYLLGFNILMWSIGSFFIFKKKGDQFALKSVFTPPILGTIFALLFVYTNATRFIPAVILDPMRMIGDTSFVLSMLVLGSWLAQIDARGLLKRLSIISEVSFLKLIIMPGLFFLFIAGMKLFSLLGIFILMEASMPSAVSLPIVAHLRKADSEFVSQGVFFSHLLSIVTIPFWLGIFLRISGLSF